MKQSTSITFSFIVISLLSCNLASAQNDYLVSAKGDTIQGKVKYLNYGNAKNVQVTPEGGKKKVYNLLQIKAFSMDGASYLNIRTSDGYTFMKLLKSGYLSYYAYQLPDQATWDGRYLQKKDGSGVELPNIGFKRILSRFLEDCEEVSKNIETKELNKSKLDVIIDEYNQCVANRSQIKPSSPAESVIPATPTSTAALNSWKELESAIKQGATFEGKENALEIINDIKLKILRNEKVSNFLINGLKESLASQPQLKTALDAALQTLPASK
jgi:hypothetical protein